ncbi:MAG: DUF4956 domain-containing protein [Flavobacterium sp.]|uniref:DUF4956 domain-containing protein n=1 Tax=Flavobacterium sp. TaxID=239 RepID=UPI0026392BF1|nr:DUF4956 domain-containing protein [Flavobacterium sp.]MDD5151367.1 DUF4956 domain-containing protein [Flavobacterium sp.]
MNEIFLYLLGFLFNLATTILITRFIYYPKNHNKNNIFTFIAFSTIIFFVVSILTSIELSVGVGFGLFALFSILRYRTDPMPIRDMTYLFIILALSVMSSIMFSEGLYTKLFVANFCVIVIIYFLEKGFGFNYEQQREIKYEKIDMIKPENRDLLLKDLKERTGIKNIIRFEIGEVDFLKDCADIIIYFKE